MELGYMVKFMSISGTYGFSGLLLHETAKIIAKTAKKVTDVLKNLFIELEIFHKNTEKTFPKTLKYRIFENLFINKCNLKMLILKTLRLGNERS
jgi:hypothetical protein